MTWGGWVAVMVPISGMVTCHSENTSSMNASNSSSARSTSSTRRTGEVRWLMAWSSGRRRRNSSEKIVLRLTRRTPPALAELDVQELLLVVPLVERGGGVESLVALQADEIGLQHPGHDLRDLRLAHAGVAFDEEGLSQTHGQVDRRRHRGVSDVLGRFHQILDLPDVVAHIVQILHEPRVVVGRIDVVGDRKVEGDLPDALRPSAHHGARAPVARQGAQLGKTAAAKSTGVPWVPR